MSIRLFPQTARVLPRCQRNVLSLGLIDYLADPGCTAYERALKLAESMAGSGRVLTFQTYFWLTFLAMVSTPGTSSGKGGPITFHSSPRSMREHTRYFGDVEY